MRHNRENDPDRDRNARERDAEPGRRAEDIRGREERDLGQAQADGNLGNERTRDRSDRGERDNPGRTGGSRNM